MSTEHNSTQCQAERTFGRIRLEVPCKKPARLKHHVSGCQVRRSFDGIPEH